MDGLAVQGEADGPTMDLSHVQYASRTSAPYSTVCQIDEAYEELGRVIEPWPEPS